MTKILPIALSGLLVTLAPVYAEEPIDLTATIGTWNIMRGIDKHRAQRIAQGISYLDPEVLVLTEVAPHKAINWILAELNAYGASYEVAFPGRTNKHEEWGQKGFQAQLGIAVLYKKGITVTHKARLIPGSNVDSQGKPRARNRKAIVMGLKVGNFDFYLVGVHFKSGGGFTSTRAAQSSVVAKYVRELLKDDEEQDVVIVGDYNMIPEPKGQRDDGPAFEALSPPNGPRLLFLSSGNVYGTGSNIWNGHINNRLDGYAISDVHTQEYIDGTLRLFPMDRAMRLSPLALSQRVADHLPLVGRFDIAEADDDGEVTPVDVDKVLLQQAYLRADSFAALKRIKLPHAIGPEMAMPKKPEKESEASQFLFLRLVKSRAKMQLTKWRWQDPHLAGLLAHKSLPAMRRITGDLLKRAQWWTREKAKPKGNSDYGCNLVTYRFGKYWVWNSGDPDSDRGPKGCGTGNLWKYAPTSGVDRAVAKEICYQHRHRRVFEITIKSNKPDPDDK